MNTYHQLAAPSDPAAWHSALYAFLAEKRRPGSDRTVASYSRMLQWSFGQAAKTPESVTSPDVLIWAHGIGLSGRQPSGRTVAARIAYLSSLHRFLGRMGTQTFHPCHALE